LSLLEDYVTDIVSAIVILETYVKLTEKSVVSAKPGRHSAGDGLYLYVSPDSQVRRWIHRFTRPTGGVTETGLGPHPVVTLEDAKTKVLEHRRLIRAGIDPIQIKRAERKAEITFKEAADKYVSTLHCSPSQHGNVRQWLYVHLKLLHSLPINQITPERVREVLAPIMHTDRATRVLSMLKRILEDNGHHLQFKLRHRVAHGHHTAMPYQQVPELMKQLQSIRSGWAAKPALALQFLILTLAPTKEVLRINRAEIVDDVWDFTRFKTNQSYRIPLSSKAIALLDNDWHGQEPRALYRLLRKLNATATVHGFRSAFVDWGFEQGGYDATLLDLCLGHKIRGVMRHYLRGDALEKRRAIMEAWADYCSGKRQSVLQAAE
jgi:integrase